MSRLVVLDTETTGLEPLQGHRIIEIGCVEIVGRKLTDNRYHVYINPDREIDADAMTVHGITNDFLADKPHFHQIADEFLAFIEGAELVIHNAPFDVGFINHEFGMLKPSPGQIENYCKITDSLVYARKKHPGQKNSLDALCKRYSIDNSSRTLHGALLDAEILADVYLSMTGGQTSLLLGTRSDSGREGSDTAIRRLAADRPALPIIMATGDELRLHEEKLAEISESSGGSCLWPAD